MRQITMLPIKDDIIGDGGSSCIGDGGSKV